MNASLADDTDSLGAPAIEIGLELMAPPREQEDLPPGPDAQAATAAAAVAEQREKAELPDLPKLPPTPSPDADQMVAPAEIKKPDPTDDQKVKAVEANPTQESVASEAMAAPHVAEAKPSPISAAPTQGTGESVARIRATWQKDLVTHLNRFKRYPQTAQRRAATIIVTFTPDRLGHVVEAKLRQGSGDPAYDRAALDMIARADPVPPAPPVIADEGLTFSLPVIFRVKR